MRKPEWFCGRSFQFYILNSCFFSPSHVWQAEGGDLQSRAEISAMKNSWIPSWLILKWELEMSNNFKLLVNFHTKPSEILKDFHYIVFVKKKDKAALKTMLMALCSKSSISWLVVLADYQYGLKYQNCHRLLYLSTDIHLHYKGHQPLPWTAVTSEKLQVLDKKAAQCSVWGPWKRAVAQKLSVDWAWWAWTGGTFATLYQTYNTVLY